MLAGTSETISIEGVKLPGKGLADIFAVKWNAGGKLQWAKHFGDEDDQFLSTAALDQEGNLVLGGTYRGFIDFPGAPLRNTSPDAYEFFVAKISPSGEARYSRSFPTGGSVAVGRDGEVIIALIRRQNELRRPAAQERRRHGPVPGQARRRGRARRLL